MLEGTLKPPQNHPKTMINLGLGEPSKANGYALPAVINQAIIDIIEGEANNGYT